MKTVRKMIVHMRHELRTPLNNIIGYTEMLIEDLPASDAAALEGELRRVHEAAQRLLIIVNDFLGQPTLIAGEVDMERLAAETSDPLDSVVAIVEGLRQDAALSGAKGIEEDLDRIATAAASLRRLISDAGAWSDGTFVTMAEPRHLSSHVPVRQAETGVILVVDDNATNRELLARRLAREGHEVRMAASGKEALDLIHQQSVDLVLLDVMMPEVDGYQVLQQLKSAERFREIPVLMISALDELDSVVRCIELGAEDYLPKPFDPVLLRARIGACLEKKHLRDREAKHLRELAEWNQMLEQRVAEQVALVDRLGRLKRFFSPHLAELIVAGGAEDPLKTHRREVTVCFADLRGFTSFAEVAEPEEVMTVLREYHAEMGKLIVEHEGTLERFTGDGMMIFFNDPIPVPNAAERTVRMAAAMRHRVAEIIERWRGLGYELDLGIGIAQGYATIGAIGYEGRWDYGAIGSVTNLAARLCGEAKPGQILVPKRVLAILNELVEAEPVGELSLKGFHRPVPTFNILRVREGPTARS